MQQQWVITYWPTKNKKRVWCCLVRTQAVADPERLAVGPAGLVELGSPAAVVPDRPLRGGGQRRETRDGEDDGGQEQHLPVSHCLFPGERATY